MKQTLLTILKRRCICSFRSHHVRRVNSCAAVRSTVRLGPVHGLFVICTTVFTVYLTWACRYRYALYFFFFKKKSAALLLIRRNVRAKNKLTRTITGMRNCVIPTRDSTFIDDKSNGAPRRTRHAEQTCNAQTARRPSVRSETRASRFIIRRGLRRLARGPVRDAVSLPTCCVRGLTTTRSISPMTLSR